MGNNIKKLFSLFNVQKNKSNEQLMMELQDGDEQAFIYLYERYKRPIFNYVFNFVQDREMAMEITQDVFTKVFSKRGQYKVENKFTTWLWSIARNSAIDSLRKKDALNFQETLGDEDTSVEDYVIEDKDSELLMIKKVEQQQVKNAFEKLGPAQREALSLRVFSELSYEEIANVLEIKVPAVKSLIHRAKKSLEKAIREENE